MATTLFDLINLIVSLINDILVLFNIDLSLLNLSIQLFSETPIIVLTAYELTAITVTILIVTIAVKITWGICKKIFNLVRGGFKSL